MHINMDINAVHIQFVLSMHRHILTNMYVSFIADVNTVISNNSVRLITFDKAKDEKQEEEGQKGDETP